MKKILGLVIIGCLTALTFPGNMAPLGAQGLAKAEPPMSSNPEIAALQARSSIFEQQLSIINKKLDKLLNMPPATVPTSMPEPIQLPAPLPPSAPPAPILRPDGTILFNGTVFVPLQATAAYGPMTVSLTADACGASLSAAACASPSSVGAAQGTPRTYLLPGKARRVARRSGAAGGC